MNVGLWQDLALQHFLPSLRRSLAGALSPAASAWEAEASNHLLAIRAGLRDLLIARDAVYRLTRSDSLPLGRRPALPGESDQPEAGARGNDLLQLIAYHAVAALNLAYSMSDNMMLILRCKTGLAASGKQSRGFAQELLDPRKALRPFADRLLGYESCTRLMALRELRNHWIHEDVVHHGRLAFEPPDTRLPEMSVIWLERKHYRAERWPALVRMSRLSADEFALITFDELMDQLWLSTTQTLKIMLEMLDWSDDQWLRADDEWRRFMQSYAGWDRRLHRALWGLTRAQSLSMQATSHIPIRA